MSFKKDEELGPDRGFEFETDDEENEAENQYYSPSSTSSSNFDANREEGDGIPVGSYQPSWPQSYRQSIDVMSSFVSPSVGFLNAGSSLIQVGNSFLRGAPELPSFTKPLIPGASTSSAIPASATAIRPGSFARASYLPELPPSPSCTTTQAIANGINVLCGVGLLATPYAVKQGGWLGLVVLFGFSLISCYTGILLKKCLDSAPGLQTYPDIGQAAFGVAGRLCISIILYMELYACCVEYITLMSNSLESMFPDASVNFLGINLTSHQVFAVTATIVVLPTVWLRDLSYLAYLSAGGVVATVLVVICLFWVGTVDGVGFHPTGTVLDLTNLPVALGLYGFCYSGHSVFPNIYSSMQIRDQFPTVLVASFTLCTIMYFGVAVAGYSMFGESIKSQFTLNMPHQFLSSKVAIWTTVANPLSKYALTMTPVALSLEELLPDTKESCYIAVFIRTFLVVSTLVVALSVPFFGFVMALLGSLFTMLVALILPCACYLSIKRSSINLLEVIMCLFIITVGVTSACIGSYSSVKQIVNHL